MAVLPGTTSRDSEGASLPLRGGVGGCLSERRRGGAGVGAKCPMHGKARRVLPGPPVPGYGPFRTGSASAYGRARAPPRE
jgi:hypothetical protein